MKSIFSKSHLDSISALLCLPVVLLTSCQSPTGRIHLDRPEVFTRERLVNRRLNDLQWLEDEMKRPISSTLQGAREQRSFSGLTVQADVQFDPLSAAGASSTAQALQLNQRVGNLQNEVLAAAWEQKLKDLESGKLKYSDVLGTNPVSTANVASNFNFTPPSSAMGLASAFTGSNALPALPSASNITIVPDRIQLTAQEQFRDRLAYRDAVSAAMREKELDDTHDRSGMTLYTLKFDLSVIPGENNRWPGCAAVTFAPGSDETELTKQYQEWVATMRQTFDQEVISIQRRYLRDFLTDEEERKLVIFSWSEEERIQSELRKELKLDTEKTVMDFQFQVDRLGNQNPTVNALSRKMTRYQQLRQALQTNKRERTKTPEILTALALTVADAFRNALTNNSGQPLVQILEPREAGHEKEDFVFLLPVRDLGEAGKRAFKCALEELTRVAQPFVYTVEPKESAQNLSDASARETVRNYSLALAAALPQAGTRGSGYVNYLKRNQYLLETIKRKPVLVGFIEHSNSFGWIIGPRFKIDENLKLSYEHSPVQQSVQATIAVPAWWSSVMINTTNRWLDDDATPFRRTNAGSANYEVRLRPDFDALTRALLERSAPSRFSAPQIHPRWDINPKKRGYVVQARKPAQLLILGRNLWRNPQIFIGSQGTRKYEVLPDMQGLVAMFDEVSPVQTLVAVGDEPAEVDLRVVTSDGETVLKNAVSVLSGTRPDQQGAFVKATNAWGVAGQNYVFVLDKDRAPKNYNSFILTIQSAGSLPVPVATNTDTTILKDGALAFRLPTRDVAAEAVANVYLKESPGSDPISVLEGGQQSLILFTNIGQSQFTTTNSITISTNPSTTATTLTVFLPATDNQLELFWKARPGLLPSLNSNPAALQLQAGETTLLLSPASFVKESKVGKAFVFSLDYTNLVKSFPPLAANGGSVTCAATVLAPAEQPRWAIPAGTLTFMHKD